MKFLTLMIDLHYNKWWIILLVLTIVQVLLNSQEHESIIE